MGIKSTVTFKDSVTLNSLLRVSRNNTEVKMKKLISAILILFLCLGIYSCSKSSDEDDLKESTTTDNDTTTTDNSTTDTTAATLAEVTAVTTPTNDTTPDYTFHLLKQEPSPMEVPVLQVLHLQHLVTIL